ncbi:hypothetical protein D3C81_1886130 [compost metagenome]
MISWLTWSRDPARRRKWVTTPCTNFTGRALSNSPPFIVTNTGWFRNISAVSLGLVQVK